MAFPAGFINVPAVRLRRSELLLKRMLPVPVLVFTEFSVRPPSGTVVVPASLMFWVAEAAELAGKKAAAALS